MGFPLGPLNQKLQYLILVIIVKSENCGKAFTSWALLTFTLTPGSLWNPEGDRIFTRQEHVSEWTGAHPGVGRLSDDPD